ncbi:hypothetical protein [Rhizobium sophorae]|nr:hypothetical protein [Rhizobium sophorae]
MQEFSREKNGWIIDFIGDDGDAVTVGRTGRDGLNEEETTGWRRPQ